MTSLLPILHRLTRPRYTTRVGRYLLAAFLCALAAPLAMAIDLPVAEWLQDARLPSELRRLVQLSEVFASGSTVILICVLVGTLDKRGLEIGAFVAAQALGAGAVSNCLKMCVARSRPWSILWPNIPPELGDSFSVRDTFVTWFPLREPELFTAAYQSFPSGHTATTVGLATALSLAYPRGRWLFALFAVMASFQRMQSLAHFPSDVLAGAAVGFACAAVTDLFGWNWGLQEDRDPADYRSDFGRYFRSAGPT